MRTCTESDVGWLQTICQLQQRDVGKTAGFVLGIDDIKLRTGIALNLNFRFVASAAFD